MTKTEIDNDILACFEDADWHLSLWFPRVAREVLRLPPDIDDAEAQRCLLDLVKSGTLEAGAVDGAEFEARPLDLSAGCCPDLFVRLAASTPAHSR